MNPSTSLGTRSKVGMAKPSPAIRQAGNIWHLLVIRGVCRKSLRSAYAHVNYRCRCRVKTLADYFSTLTHAEFTTMPEVHELGVTDEHLQLDPAFFGPLVDQPLQVAFQLVR